MSITAVRGLRVGHWTNAHARTGCTVVIAPAGSVGGVDVRGGAPGTLGTDLLHPLSDAPGPHAVLLTGGSAYGLAAAAGVMRWLEEHRIGREFGGALVPLVSAAVIFDLSVGDGAVRPDAASGYSACEAATDGPIAEGAVGAGTGATYAKLGGTRKRGGIGSASTRVGDATVGALFVVNAVGEVAGEDGMPVPGRTDSGAGANTTIGVVATDAQLTKVEANLLARIAHDGIAIAVRPAHTQRDGDTTFAMATGLSGAVDLVQLQIATVAVTVEAIRRAVR